MKFIVVLLATLFIPIVPWVALAPLWVARDKGELTVFLLVLSGIVLDLWWGTSLGLTALFLLGISFLVRAIANWWPSDQRVFTILAIAISAILMEAYLVLV